MAGVAALRRNPWVWAGAMALGVGLVLLQAALDPLRGSVYGTVIDESGIARAVIVDIPSLTAKGPIVSGLDAAVIAAVPSPDRSRAAFVSKAKGRQTELSIGMPNGAGAVSVRAGVVSAPSWSPDGGSIAFSVHATGTDPSDPEVWEVVRAVTNGDSLVVGRGFRPYPSPLQRTYAITRQGIALLSYNDQEPVVVVASPVPVPASTPFAVSQDGTRLAWVAPADRSLQVFENVNGYFVPLFVSPDSALHSFAFSPSGKHLIGVAHAGATSTLQLVAAQSGTVRMVGEVPGYLMVHAWRYEN